MRSRVPFNDPDLEAAALLLDERYAATRQQYPGTRRGYQAHRRGMQELNQRATLLSSAVPTILAMHPPTFPTTSTISSSHLNTDTPEEKVPSVPPFTPSSTNIRNDTTHLYSPTHSLTNLPIKSDNLSTDILSVKSDSLPTDTLDLLNELPFTALNISSSPSPFSEVFPFDNSTASPTPTVSPTRPLSTTHSSSSPLLSPTPLLPIPPQDNASLQLDETPANDSIPPSLSIVTAITAISQFWCTCEPGTTHISHSATQNFGIQEAAAHLSAPPTTTRSGSLPDPWNVSSSSPPSPSRPIPFTELLSAGYAEAHHLKLHIRDTVEQLDATQDIITTFDVDSVWYPLTLADITVPIQIAYTAQRQHTITQNPQVSFHNVATHTVVHTAIGQLYVDSALLRLYLFFPHLPGGPSNYITDEQQQVWVDHYLLPALRRSYPSYQHQDHPKSWQDAHWRSRARAEQQLQEHAPLANFGYMLHPRYLVALQDDLDHHLPASTVSTDHPHYDFRGSFFMLIGHNFKLQFRDRSHASAITYYHDWVARFLRPAYRASIVFQRQAYVDFGIEHSPTIPTDQEAVTFLLRRSCLQQKLAALHGSRAQHTADTIFPWAHTYDAASALQVVSPANQHHQHAGIVYIKHYNVDKHRFGTPFHGQTPFLAEFLELVVFTSAQLLAAQKATRTSNYSHEVSKSRSTLSASYHRLITAMQASTSSHYAYRTEVRLHHEALFLLGAADLPSLTNLPTTTSSPTHPSCFLLRSTDVVQFWLAQIRRYALAFESQTQLAIEQPSLAWNDPYVGLHLATATTFRRLLNTLFTGILWPNQLARPGYFDRRPHWPSRQVRDDTEARQQRLIATQQYHRCDRIGLNMRAIIEQLGMYWPWDYLFTYDHGVQLRLGLVPKMTFSRFRAWSIPLHQSWFRRAGRTEVSFQQPALRLFVREVVDDCRAFTEQYGSTHDSTLPYRLIVLHLLEPIVARIAIDYFEYIQHHPASRSNSQPLFAATSDHATPFYQQGEPLTYLQMCHLLGSAPHLKPTRSLTRQAGLSDQGRTWDDRLRMVFDPSFPHRKPPQWNDASFRISTRQYLHWMIDAGLAQRECDLFTAFLPRLLAAYIWIMPMFDERTLIVRDRQPGPNLGQPSFMVQLADLQHRSLTAIRHISPAVDPQTGHLLVASTFTTADREHLTHLTAILRSIHFIVGFLRDSPLSLRASSRRAKMMRQWWHTSFPVFSHSPPELENLPGLLFLWDEQTMESPPLLRQPLQYAVGRVATLAAELHHQLHRTADGVTRSSPTPTEVPTTQSPTPSDDESSLDSSHATSHLEDGDSSASWTPRRPYLPWSRDQMDNFHHPDFNPK